MAKKKDRIDFFKFLVCPPDVRDGETPFESWCNEIISKEEYLENRSFLILEFYSAFRKVYDYFSDSYLSDELYKLYCTFSDNDSVMIVTAKYNNYRIEDSFIKELKKYFYPDSDDDYTEFEVIYDHAKHNTVKLKFSKE